MEAGDEIGRAAIGIQIASIAQRVSRRTRKTAGSLEVAQRIAAHKPLPSTGLCGRWMRSSGSEFKPPGPLVDRFSSVRQGICRLLAKAALIPALPFCHATLVSPKPRNPQHPKTLDRIGDHIAASNSASSNAKPPTRSASIRAPWPTGKPGATGP
jgi:hypothetical protein